MKPTPRTVHHLALAAAAGMSGIALFDAGTKVVTGHYSVFSDEGDVPWLWHASDVVHGLTYVALMAVLLQHRATIERANLTARVSFWVVLCSLGTLAAGFFFMVPFLDPENIPPVPAAVVGVAFAGMLLGAPVLGIAVRRVPELHPGNLVLMAMVPILLVTLLLGFVAPAFAHPAYLETALGFGVALLGYRAASAPAAAGLASAVPVSVARRRP